VVGDDQVCIVEDVGGDAVEAVADDRRQRSDRLLDRPVRLPRVVAVGHDDGAARLGAVHLQCRVSLSQSLSPAADGAAAHALWSRTLQQQI
jgi:hypothetical protein